MPNATEVTTFTNFLEVVPSTNPWTAIKNTSSNAFTISFWCNSEVANNNNLANEWGSLFTGYTPKGTESNRAWYYPVGPDVRVRGQYHHNNKGYTDNNHDSYLEAASKWRDGKWHHFAWVFSGLASSENFTLTLYIDGKEIYSVLETIAFADKTGFDMLTDLDRFVIGGASPIFNDPDNAYAYDDVQLFSSALSATLVQQIIDIKKAMGVCKTWETSAEFSTAIDAKLAAGDFDTADDVYAFHTNWQVTHGSLSKVIINNAVTNTTGWNGTSGTLNEGADYTGAPDTKYLSHDTNAEGYNVNQIVYGLPAGTYKISVWTYSSIGADRNIYIETVGSTWTPLVTPQPASSDTGWKELTAEFTLTETSNVAFGFWAPQAAGRIAGFDNWQLSKVISYNYTVNAVDGNGKLLKELATGTDNSGARITQKVPQFVLVGTTLYETAQVADAYSTVFDLLEDNKVVNVLYTSVAENVVFFAEGEDVISGYTFDRKDASLGIVGGRSKTSATDYVNWTTLPAGKWNVCVRTFTGNSGEHTLNIKMDTDSEPQATETYTSDDAWQIADKKITAANAGTLQIGFNGGRNTGIDWVYIQGTPSHEVVGATDCSTEWTGAKNNTPICINAGETAKYTFVNHNSRAGEIWNNWYLLAKATADANAANVVAIRADQWYDAGVTQSDNTLTGNGFNYVSDYDGAKVEISIALTEGENSTYTMTATTKVIKADGTEAGSKVDTATGLTQSKLYLYMSVFNSWLELVSEKVGVSMNQYGWATFASDNALDFSNTDLTAYAISSIEGDITVKNEVATTTAGKGLLVSGVEGNYLVPVIAPANVDENAAAYLESTLLVRGTGANVEAGTDKANYVLSVYKNSAMFKKIESDPAFVPVNKAYLVLDNGLNAAPKYIGIVGGEATGIDNLNVDEENDQVDGAIYNLAGQRVSKDYKGLVIKNGKKVIIK